MSLLKATCPRCRSEVDTGVHVDQQTMKELGPKLQVLVRCDNCREYQKMLLQDLYLLAETADAA